MVSPVKLVMTVLTIAIAASSNCAAEVSPEAHFHALSFQCYSGDRTVGFFANAKGAEVLVTVIRGSKTFVSVKVRGIGLIEFKEGLGANLEDIPATDEKLVHRGKVSLARMEIWEKRACNASVSEREALKREFARSAAEIGYKPRSGSPDLGF